MIEVLSLFLKTDAILSLLLVVIVVGFGFWFSRSGWPFIQEYVTQRQKMDHELQLNRVMAEAASDERWQDVTMQMATNFASLREEIGSFRESVNGFTRLLNGNGK
jgi:hypothetical protein